jgi:hypothetical protein
MHSFMSKTGGEDINADILAAGAHLPRHSMSKAKNQVARQEGQPTVRLNRKIEGFLSIAHWLSW